MSILIKGMEMPKYDTFHLTLLDDGTVCDGVWGDVVAQAVELPPHGRLIDADELPTIKYHDLPYIHITPSDVDAESYERGWNDAVDAVVDDAPVIIPAERVFPIEMLKRHRTNADRIRSMTDEELAEFLQDIPYFTHDALMVWLKEET